MEKKYIIVSDTTQLPDFDKDLPIFSDIETEGLYTKLRTIQFYQPQTSDKVYIIDLAPPGYDKVDYIRVNHNVKTFVHAHWTIWYNCSYDLGTMNVYPERFDDLYYLVKTAYAEFQEFGLKKVVKKFKQLEHMYVDTEEDHGSKGFPLGSYISASQYRYASNDVIALAILWEDRKIQYYRDNLAYKVDIISQRYALEYQQNGLILNKEAWEKEVTTAEENIKKTEALLPKTLNVNSPKQVKEFLGTEKSDAATLIMYALSSNEKSKYAGPILDLRKYRKQYKYLLSIDHKKMYTKFNVAGTVTGRFSAKGGDLENGFNAQQIPRSFFYLFKQPTEDTEVIGLDYGTLELRLAASLFNEPAMAQQFSEGRDLHTDMAMMVSGKELAPDGEIVYVEQMTSGHSGSIDGMNHEHLTSLDRQIGKSLNFGMVFGMSAKKYQTYAFANFGIKLTLEEATDFRNKYFKKYPAIGKYHKGVWENYQKSNFVVTTALGRRIKPKLGTDAINAPVQGTGAEVTKLSIHYLIKDNPDEPILKMIFVVIHDAIYLRVPKGKKEYYEDLLRKAMIKGWQEIQKTEAFKIKTIEMVVD